MTRQILLLIVFLGLVSSTGLAQLAQISTLTPNTILANTPTDVTVRGINTHFQKGVSMAHFNGNPVQFSISNIVTATVTIPSVPPGTYTLTISTRTESVSATITIFSIPASTLTANIVILPMESISLKDIDLSNPQSTPVLFEANVYNGPTKRSVKLKVNVSSASQGFLGSLSRQYIDLAASPGVGSSYSFSNRDFNSLSVNGTTGQNFLNQVEITGVFPPDDYTYSFIVIDSATGKTVDSVTTTTIITNPLTNPSLITPGAAFTDNLQVEYTPMPLFQWFGQNDKYDFALYEWRAGQTQEEAVRNVAVYKQLDVSGNSMLYPNSAEKLIDGMTYAWQVQGKVVSTNSIRYLPSEVFRFTYRNAQTAGIKLVSGIQITPEEIVVPAGGQYQFTAVCYDENNTIIPNAALTWAVTPNNGSITQSGLFTAGQGGNSVAIVVSAGTATEFATVTVSLSGISSYLNPYDGFIKKLFGLQ